MSSFVKASVLGLGLLTGVAFAAQAQTDTTASLPPNALELLAPEVEY